MGDFHTQPEAAPVRQVILAKAQYFVDCKYVARADERQKSMGLAYVEAERQDLAKEIANFAMSSSATQARVDELTKALDTAWEKINALGGSQYQDNSYDQGIVDTVAKALEIIERAKAMPLEQSGSGK